MTTEPPLFERPRIVAGRGPRACERALLEAIEQQLAALGDRVLARPIYLLVPSHSLRTHLLERLVRDRCRSVAGVGCWTLRGLALEVLERLGANSPVGGGMLPILVRRQARQHRTLRESLDHLTDGYASLVGTVSDLLEAGLDPAHAEALDEALASEGPGIATQAEIRRARSLVRVAVSVREEMERLGLGDVSSLLQQATDLLRATLDLPFQTSGFHVYGFADATGVATDFITAVLDRFGGTAYLDRPPEPTNPAREDPSVKFSRRFSERLLAMADVDEEVEAIASGNLDLIAALGARAEVREIGWRIRQLVDAGTRPEDITVVARQLEPYRSALRTHFHRLGIPFSALGTLGPQLPVGRRIRAVLDVVAKREQVSIDRWLDARPPGAVRVPVFDLQLALFGFGLSRLDELAEWSRPEILTAAELPLPARLGFSTDAEGDAETRLDRRRVPTEAVRDARDDAIRLIALFADWKKCRAWSDHLQHFQRLLSTLGWSVEDDLPVELGWAIDRLAGELPATLELELDEASLLLADVLGSIGFDQLGGRGGGIQVLDVIEARSRTCEHLFVLGLNKGNFPRHVREDPAFPDSLRQVLGREGHGVLPDLSRKRAGYAEERFLFAQLLASSPDVTLAWQVADDDNNEMTPSPLVEQFQPLLEPQRVHSPRSLIPSRTGPPAPRTASEHAVRAALWGSRRQLEDSLIAACPADAAANATLLARARLRLVDELNRPGGRHARLGPYHGFIGAAVDPAEPRLAQELYITTLERFAACPWRTFLERILRLEALPDPVEILPGLDAILIGQLVHRVLERLVRAGIPENPPSLDAARASEAVEISWPETAELVQLVQEQAAAVASDQGIAWQGFAAVLAQVSMPYLEQARELIWNDPDGLQPVAAEMECSLEIGNESPPRSLRFKADRVDAVHDRLLLSDYKTSRQGISKAKQQKTRDKHLLDQIRKGRLLQAVAYALASGDPDDRGRYVFVRPDFTSPEESRIVRVAASDTAALEAFESAVTTLLRAWYQGTFFPRIVEPEADREPLACDYCSVAEACVRGDSGARSRLRDWSARQRARNTTEEAFLDSWFLASAQGRAR